MTPPIWNFSCWIKYLNHMPQRVDRRGFDGKDKTRQRAGWWVERCRQMKWPLGNLSTAECSANCIAGPRDNRSQPWLLHAQRTPAGGGAWRRRPGGGRRQRCVDCESIKNTEDRKGGRQMEVKGSPQGRHAARSTAPWTATPATTKQLAGS